MNVQHPFVSIDIISFYLQAHGNQPCVANTKKQVNGSPLNAHVTNDNTVAYLRFRNDMEAD